MREMCEAISRMLGLGGRTESMTVGQAAGEWGEGAANDSMGSNSRVRAVRARSELGWSPPDPRLSTKSSTAAMPRCDEPGDAAKRQTKPR